MVVPKTEKQNLDVVAIAEQYYKVENQTWVFINTYIKQICEAKQNSGKTIWIGINSEVNMNEWKISGENEEIFENGFDWQVATWLARGLVIQIGRTRVQMATVHTFSQRWDKVPENLGLDLFL